jgi:hypothetical protein
LASGILVNEPARLFPGWGCVIVGVGVGVSAGAVAGRGRFGLRRGRIVGFLILVGIVLTPAQSRLYGFLVSV